MKKIKIKIDWFQYMLDNMLDVNELSKKTGKSLNSLYYMIHNEISLSTYNTLIEALPEIEKYVISKRSE